MAESKSKDPVVRIDSLRGKSFSLPHAGNPEAGGVFEVDEDGLVKATANDIKNKKKVGRKQVPLTEEQAEAIVRLRHLDGAVRVE
jgi:hypothetical protein